MSCKDCTDDCRQGRDCPHRKSFDVYQYYRFFNLYTRLTTNFTLMEWIVCLTTIAILLSLAI
jgi:hypothetical protein